MNKCDMAGCVDMAQLTAQLNTEAITETLELCGSCAQYLRGYFIGLGNMHTITAIKYQEGNQN
jgi:hypothetical protein